MYKDDFKQHFLINLHKFLIPVIDVSRLFITRVILFLLDWIIFMMISPFENLPLISIPKERRAGTYLLEDIHSDIVEGNRTFIILNI
jgi:hypothetical protein